MPSAFLSYARINLRFAKKLEAALRSRGVDVWRDKTRLKVGQSWPEAIGLAISKCDFFILVWSKAAAESKKITTEWNAASAQGKPILPCFIDATPLPEALAGIHAVDGRAFRQAVEQISEAIEAPPSVHPRKAKRRLAKPLIGACLLAIGAVFLWTLASPYFRQVSDKNTVLRVADGVQFEFVEIQPGTFKMGSESGDADEKPVLRVNITQGFQLGKHEVSQRQWEAFSGRNPSHFKGARLPVENVSWDDVQGFLKALNSRGDGWLYRLPTEAEWEYAARAGVERERQDQIEETSWYRANSGGQTHEVGTKKPNAWGLHDMQGNVWEWVQDWYAERYVARSNLDPNPVGPPSGTHRVIRGGGWDSPAEQCRPSNRGEAGPESQGDVLGFRLLRQRRNRGP